MVCTWLNTLQGTQVWKTGPPQGRFLLPVCLNRKMVDVLTDMGCGTTLVKQAMGPFTSEVLRMSCIHGDVKNYRTKWEELRVGNQLYNCKVGVVPHLDCAMLIGRDCSVLPTLLRSRPIIPKATSLSGGQAEEP